jgi:hypothetical protein
MMRRLTSGPIGVARATVHRGQIRVRRFDTKTEAHTVESREVRRCLGRGEHVIGGYRVVRVRKLDRSDGATEPREIFDGSAHARADLGVETLGEIFFGHADTDAAHAPFASGLVSADGCVDARRIELVAPRDDFEDARGSTHVAGEGSDRSRLDAMQRARNARPPVRRQRRPRS